MSYEDVKTLAEALKTLNELWKNTEWSHEQGIKIVNIRNRLLDKIIDLLR